jgi:nitrogen fixation protein FixH
MAAGRGLFRNGVTGRHVLSFMLAFFGVSIGVNGAFTWLAVSTFSGVETDAAYQKGLRYNDVLADAARQTELGWRVTTAYDQAEQQLVVDLVGRLGSPLGGQQVSAVIGRPASDRYDRHLQLTERGTGRHVAAIPLEPGQWDVLVRVGEAADGSAVLQTRTRLFVRPESGSN